MRDSGPTLRCIVGTGGDLTTDAGIAAIALVPDALNSFDERMCNEFEHAWKRIRETDEIHAVFLRANLESRAFCTGVDVKNGYDYDAPENPFNRQDPGEFLGPKQNLVWKPVVCAIHGLAAGGAFYWINECDVVIRSGSTRWSSFCARRI